MAAAFEPGGTMIPARVTAMLAPAWVADFDEARNHWRTRPHGIDLSDIATLTINETHMLQSEVQPDDLVAAPQQLWSHDAYTSTLEEADSVLRVALMITSSRSLLECCKAPSTRKCAPACHIDV